MFLNHYARSQSVMPSMRESHQTHDIKCLERTSIELHKSASGKRCTLERGGFPLRNAG